MISQTVVTLAAHPYYRTLGRLVTTDNSSSDVWANAACQSKANETMLADRILRSQIHRKKPRGKAKPKPTGRDNAKKSTKRARFEHVFAYQK